MKERASLFAEEQVDFDFLMSIVEEAKEGATTDELIDRFLELKDFRIAIDAEEDGATSLPTLQEPLNPIDDSSSLNDISEELAQIYYAQGLYQESKDIYNQLFLLYSEKIVYFATQIDHLTALTATEATAEATTGGQKESEAQGERGEEERARGRGAQVSS